jgi:tetratricopeptide (TPR) repeat protein
MPRMPITQRTVATAAFMQQQETMLLAQATAAHHANRLMEAKAGYEAVLRINPNHTEVLTLLGTLILQSGNPTEAIRLLDLSLRADRRQPHALNARGIALCEVRRFEPAVADFEQAIALHLPTAHGNLANALNYLGRSKEALDEYEQALAIDPEDPELYHNRGSALIWLGQYADALASFDRALALRPDYAEARFHRAELLLLLGDFANGWEQFEWRWKLEEAKSILRRYEQPLWLGREDIAGKTILLHAEQGYGDMLQFCRFVELVEARQAKVVLEVPRPLKRLMATLRGSPLIVDNRDDAPPCDFHCPLMSLPLALGITPATIPSTTPYLAADPDLEVAWAARLGTSTRPRIGLVWFGSMTSTASHIKSMAFDDILGLTGCAADFYSLQKQQIPGDELAFQSNNRVVELGPELQDFADTAAAIAQLDLVITVDTSVAHLAGALGKPVWIMLSYLKDWRWQQGGSTTPWYPTATLFRQPSPNDWNSVVGAVEAELRCWIVGTATD